MELVQDRVEAPTTKTTINVGFWARVLADIIDLGILFAGAFVLGVVITNELVHSLVVFVACWLYFAGFESSAWQGTPGKKQFDYRVTNLNGSRISFARATGRYFARLLAFGILHIGVIMAAFTQKKRGLHDLIAMTVVVEP